MPTSAAQLWPQQGKPSANMNRSSLAMASRAMIACSNSMASLKRIIQMTILSSATLLPNCAGKDARVQTSPHRGWNGCEHNGSERRQKRSVCHACSLHICKHSRMLDLQIAPAMTLIQPQHNVLVSFTCLGWLILSIHPISGTRVLLAYQHAVCSHILRQSLH